MLMVNERRRWDCGKTDLAHTESVWERYKLTVLEINSHIKAGLYTVCKTLCKESPFIDKE